MKKRLFSLLIVLSASSFCSAQEYFYQDSTVISPQVQVKKLDLRTPIINIIVRNLNFDPFIIGPEDGCQMMTVAVSFNAEGKIDSAYFSEKLSDKMGLVLNSRDRVAQALMNSGLVLEGYENSVMMFPMIFSNATDRNITFHPQSGPLFNGFWPVMDTRDQKKIIKLLDPYINVYMIAVN
jgi:hypothetical protein